MQEFAEPLSAVESVPPGAWAVGVSGGADSVALLSRLRMRADLSLCVAHLDHQTRGSASAEDAKFVTELARRWNLPCDVATLEQVLPAVHQPPKNRSARFRAARLAMFRRVVEAHGLQGVILAHHADDQAETVLLRLLRGSGFSGLGGMARSGVIGGLTVLRPMLGVTRAELRAHLQAIDQPWCEDESNLSPRYARNRARAALAARPELVAPLIELGQSCRALACWSNETPAPPAQMPVCALQDVPAILARPMARKWLLARGAPAGDLLPAVLDRLIAMAADRATPHRQDFPGRLTVLRRRAFLFVE